LIGAPSGGGIPTNAGSSTQSLRPPRGVRTAALGRITSLKGGWRLWFGAVTGCCWVGMEPRMRVRRGLFRFHGAVSVVAASRVSTCVSSCTGSGSVSIGAPGWPRWAGPSERGPACAGASELDCAASRGWKRFRRVAAGGPSEKGRSLAADRVVGAPPAGPAGWKRWTSRLRSILGADSRGAACPCGGVCPGPVPGAPPALRGGGCQS